MAAEQAQRKHVLLGHFQDGLLTLLEGQANRQMTKSHGEIFGLHRGGHGKSLFEQMTETYYICKGTAWGTWVSEGETQT